MIQDRTTLRQQLRQRRRDLTAAARIAAAEALAGRILALPFLPRQGHVAGYWAMDGEIGLHVLQLRLPPGLVWCLPVLAGEVLRLAPWRPGEPLVEIVPQGDTLVIEAQVRPADIAFVHIGQKAFVKLTAYDYSVYGGMDGVVERISPDATVNEKTGESYFTIRVATRGKALTAPDGQPLPIGVGMIAEVDLLGHKRSIMSYLLTPVTKLSDNAFRER